MARHRASTQGQPTGKFARPPGRIPGSRTVRRRPGLPGVRRAEVPLGRLGDPRAIPTGLEPFAGFGGVTPAGGTTRGTPQERADLARRVGLRAGVRPGPATTGFPPRLPPIGADDPIRGLGQLGPKTGGTSVGLLSAPNTAGFGGHAPEGVAGTFFGDAAQQRAHILAQQKVPTAKGGFFTPIGTQGKPPGFIESELNTLLSGQRVSGGGAIQDTLVRSGPFAGQNTSDVARLAQRERGGPLGQVEGLTSLGQRRLGQAAQAQGRFRQGSILPPVPFQSFDDFFAARSLQRQFQNQVDNPFDPAKAARRLTPEQARLRAAGQPFTDATGALRQPGSLPAGQPGGGLAGGGLAAPPIQQSGPPTGAFGSGGGFGAGFADGGGATGTVGFNAGLLENQALFAALREALMQRLIPQALGV